MEKGWKKPGKLDNFIEYILVDHRWIFVCLFLLPMSLVYDLYSYFRSWIVFKMSTAPKAHDEKVAKVQRQVKGWKEDGANTFMCTGRPGWQTICFRQPVYKDQFRKININLVDILKVDIENKLVTVEPMVTMGQLSATLEPLGWTIPVLPELDDLTVGGLVMGTGVETSSHVHGLFQHICNAYELVLSDASRVRCSKEEHTDLFYAVPWSYGTIGFLTSVEIRMVPAKKYVKLEYHPVHSLDDACRILQDKSQKVDENQFVEGILYDQSNAVIMTGNMVNYAEKDKVNCIGRWYQEWFYKHAEKFLTQKGPCVEYIPLRDYYHRHSRSIFWEMKEIIPFGNSWIFRTLFGWMVPPKVSLLKLTQPKAVKRLYESHHILQDMLVPMSALKKTIRKFDEETKVYPVWLCPFILPNNPGMLQSESNDAQLYVDVGVYGVPLVKNYNPEETTRRLEKFVRENHGFQMLYADTFMTKQEFRAMFDHKLYDEVRQKYSATKAFPEVYDKVSKNARV